MLPRPGSQPGDKEAFDARSWPRPGANKNGTKTHARISGRLACLGVAVVLFWTKGIFWDAHAASLPMDLEAMEAFGSRGEEGKWWRHKTTVIMQFGGLAKTLGKSRNVKWQPSCTNDGRLYPQRLQTRSRTESVLGHRDVTARGHINEVDLVCLQKSGLRGQWTFVYIYIYITKCPSQALNRDS